MFFGRIIRNKRPEQGKKGKKGYCGRKRELIGSEVFSGRRQDGNDF
jgi:hypothetical protein